MLRWGLLVLGVLLAAGGAARAGFEEKVWAGPPPVVVDSFTARSRWDSPGRLRLDGVAAIRNVSEVNLEKVDLAVVARVGNGEVVLAGASLANRPILGGGEAALKAGESHTWRWYWDNPEGYYSQATVEGVRLRVTGLVPLEGHTSGMLDGKVARFTVEARPE